MSELLREVLTALDMPEKGLLRWFAKSRRFCESHGGERYYAEWMALYEQCVASLTEVAGRRSQSAGGHHPAAEGRRPHLDSNVQATDPSVGHGQAAALSEQEGGGRRPLADWELPTVNSTGLAPPPTANRQPPPKPHAP